MKKIILIFVLASLSIFAQEDLKYEYDDSGNRIEKSSNEQACDCFCPNSTERNSWLTLNVVTDAGCGPDKCKLTGIFQIPPEYACYTHYKIDDGTTLSSMQTLPVNISQIEQCIPAGQTVTITILLYRYDGDPPCKIEKTSDYCNADCCEFIDIEFTETVSASTDCCWTPEVVTDDGIICDIGSLDIEAKYYDENDVEFEEGGLPQMLCPEDITVVCDASTDPSSTGFPSGAGSCSEISISYSDSIVEISGGTSGTENCCDDDCGTFRTQTQGGWGSTSHGNNPGSYRDAHFPEAFPNGLVVGCDFSLTLTSSEAVQNFLPSGGSTQRLSSDLTDPTGFKSTLAGQMVAATLSVGFDYADPNYSESAINLGELTVSSGEFSGQTVNQFLEVAQNYFGGCASPYTGSQLISVLAGINENFVDGNQDHGFLDCPEGEEPIDPSANCFEIIRTWVATDACGNEVTCQQVIIGEVSENNLVIEETQDKTLLAYPSPTNNWVYLAKVSEMKAGDMIRVLNVSGQEMFRFTTPEIEDKVSLDLSTLERGMYIIEWNGTELLESVIVFKN
jgi:hypothetical protein